MKKGSILLLVILLTAILFSSCMGDELGRLKVNATSTSDEDLKLAADTLDLAQGEQVAVWSEMDMEYEGDVALQFKMQALLDGELVEEYAIDPFEGNVTMNAKEVSLGNSTSKSFTKKNMTFTAPDSGSYVFVAYLVSDGNPSLVLNKAEILLTK